jgi:protein CpxP
LILLLLLLNFGILGFLWQGRGHDRHEGGPPPPPDRMIIERLQLNDRQQEQFEGFRDEHHAQMVDLQERSAVLHKQLFALLKDKQVNARAKDSIMNLLQQNSNQREEITFEHFRKLRSILTPRQQAEFDSFVEEVSERILGPHRGPGR